MAKFKFKEHEPDANPETHILVELTNFKDMVLLGTIIKTPKSSRKGRGRPSQLQLCATTTRRRSCAAMLGDFKLQKMHSMLVGLLTGVAG
jgi:hypothetical protein